MPDAEVGVFSVDAGGAESSTNAPVSSRGSVGLTAAAVLLGALTYGMFDQASFYGGQFVRLMAGVGLAGVLSALGLRPTARDRRALPLFGLGALASSAVLSAAVQGRPGSAAGTVALLVGVGVVMFVASRCPDPLRETLITAVLVLGVLIALSGWAGVAGHRRPEALVDQGLWRAASSITYANGTAGLLAPLAVFTLARASASKRLGDELAAMMMLTGLLATLSRAGLLALAAGIAALAVLSPPRRRLVRVLSATFLGGAVAIAGLGPSFPQRSAAHPVEAALFLVLGALVVVGAHALYERILPERASRRRLGVSATVSLAAGAVVAVILAAAAISHPISRAFGEVRRARVTASSPDRAAEWRASWDLVRAHPVVGVGPGPLELTWRRPSGEVVSVGFTHNEYLQLLAQQGLLGLICFGALGVEVALRLRWRGVRRARDGRVACIAGLVAFSVHSGLDFLWHLPGVVLVMAALIGVSVAPRRDLSCQALVQEQE